MRKTNMFILLFLFLLPKIMEGQQIQYETVKCERKLENTYISILPPLAIQAALRENSEDLGKITVESSTFNQLELEIIKYPAQIWAALLEIKKPIKIKIEKVYMNTTNILANTQIGVFKNNYSKLPVKNMQYPIALAKQLDESINFNDYDMIISVNTNQTINWNIAKDGVPIKDKYDLVTVLLHEIGHGLGIVSSFNKLNGNGCYNYTGFDSISTGSYPVVYDKFVKFNADTSLIRFPNQSVELLQKLTSNNVYFTGENAKIANGGNVKIFSPEKFAAGTSIAHLDEDKYSTTIHTLMCPYRGMAEVIYNPGTVSLGILKDLGWKVKRIISFIQPVWNNRIMKGSPIDIKWSDNNTKNSSIYLSLYKYSNNDWGTFVCDIAPNGIISYPGTQGNLIKWTVPATLEDGYYFIKIESLDTIDLERSNYFYITLAHPDVPMIIPQHGQMPLSVTALSTTPGAIVRYTIGENTNPTNVSPIVEGSIFLNEKKNTTVVFRSFYTWQGDSVVCSDKNIGTYTPGDTGLVDVIPTFAYSDGEKYTTTNGGQSCQTQYNACVIGRRYMGYPPNINRSLIKFLIPPNIVSANTEITKVEIALNGYYNKAGQVKIKEVGQKTGNMFLDVDRWTMIQQISYADTSALIPQLIDKVKTLTRNGGGWLELGLEAVDETTEDFLFDISLYRSWLKIYVQPNVILDQIDENGTEFGQVGLYRNGVWEINSVPAIYYCKSNTDYPIKSQEGYRLGTNQKFNNWSGQPQDFTTIHANLSPAKYVAKYVQAYRNIQLLNSFDGSNISNIQNQGLYFADPWLKDEQVGQLGKRNRPNSPLFYRLATPFNMAASTGTDYSGVFLNVSSQTSWQAPYYSVKADETQNITLPNGTQSTAWFTGWRAVPESSITIRYPDELESPIIFNRDNASVVANYKATGITNMVNTFANNSQRKVCNEQNSLLRVYESMGNIWLEMSTDNGESWQLWGGGTPLNIREAKNPAIISDQTGNFLIVYQQRDEGSPTSSHLYCATVMGGGEPLNGTAVPFEQDANPVVTMYNTGIATDPAPAKGMVIWQNAQINNISGLGYILFETFGTMVPTITKREIIENTNQNSKNPTVDYSLDDDGAYYFHAAWQQDDAENSAIMYKRWQVVNINGGLMFQQTSQNISANNGFTRNCRPSILGAGTDARVVWIGERSTIAVGRQPETGGSLPPLIEKRVVMHAPLNPSWYAVKGWDVNSPFIASDPGNCYAYAWTEGSGTECTVKFSDHSGNDHSMPGFNASAVQIFNGDGSGDGTVDFSKLRACTFSNSALPYYLNTTQGFNTYMPAADQDPGSGENPGAEKATAIGKGREGVIRVDSCSFYFGIGDVRLGYKAIEFARPPAGSAIANIGDLNGYLKTKAFSVSNNTTLNFSIGYGITDSARAALVMQGGKYVRFKLQLVDNATNTVLGTVKEIVFNSENIAQYDVNEYQLSMAGIGNKTVRLQLTAESNAVTGMSVADVTGSASTLSKRAPQRMNLAQAGVVTTYALEQNYPNPFNPTTTINYQIPKAGHVTLKIYDMLGREVRSLVDEQKETGKYSVVFTASNLASGVYIYQIKCGDYKASRKLVLMK